MLLCAARTGLRLCIVGGIMIELRARTGYLHSLRRILMMLSVTCMSFGFRYQI